MQKNIEMQLKTIINVFKKYAQIEYVEEYINCLESSTSSLHEKKFSINKLIDYCIRDSWTDEEKDLRNIIKTIERDEKQRELIDKTQEPINKFWISFYEWMNSDLPKLGWLYDSYVDYKYWNNRDIFILNFNYDNIFRKYLGIPYDNRYENKNSCKLEDIKVLIELIYKELIQTHARYDFTIYINKMFNRFQLPFELKSGKLSKKGYKSTETNLPILNFQMLESKIQWSEDKILGLETLDKHTALNYITDSLQYLLSLINALEKKELTGKKIKQRCAYIADNNINGKIYSVISNEIDAIQTIVNEYFDIRHNEYLSKKSNTKRESLKDKQFIEYLYNRIYAILFYMKSKYIIYNNTSLESNE